MVVSAQMPLERLENLQITVARTVTGTFRIGEDPNQELRSSMDLRAAVALNATQRASSTRRALRCQSAIRVLG
jgi:hypothetical protein